MVRLRPTLELRRGDELVTHVLALPGAVWFQGHFPSAPLLPGVAMLALVDESVALFWPDDLHPPVRIEGFRRVRFRQRVKPGAILRVSVHQTQPNSLRFAVDVGGLVACTGECRVIAESVKDDRSPSRNRALPGTKGKGAMRRWLLRRRLVQRALATPTDPMLLRRPPVRVVVGLSLLGVSYVLGWPAVIALGAAAAWLRQPKLLLGGPIIYGLSWLVFAIGLAFIGSKSVSAGRALGRLLVRRLAEKFLLD
jgi:hypothetical protein